ncbi:MAG: hypothetical protein H0U55_06310 [Rubrobacteraceae bacterium]|nr:hypothetical protein [Rubrobacteraceae bacterium]
MTVDELDDARSFFPLPSTVVVVVVVAVGTTSVSSSSTTIPGGAPNSNSSSCSPQAHQQNENAQKTSCQWRRMARPLLTW